MDGQARGWLKHLEDKRREFEALLVAVGIHGPSVVLEENNIALVRWARRYAPDALAELADEMDGESHADDCACWRCVLRLNARAVKAAATRKLADRADLD